MYSHVVVAGTFDHIHKGHIALLTKAFAVGESVTIGLTSDAYVNNYKSKSVQPYGARKKNLLIWLKNRGVLTRTTIVSIDDAYGPIIRRGFTVQAIVVSTDTESTARRINSKRKELHFPLLAIIVVPMIPAEDMRAISSTRIRNGEIDHEGRLVLPQSLRRVLAKSIGTLIPDGSSFLVPGSSFIISVGDGTTEKLLSQGIVPTLAIIDFQVQRQAFDWEKTLWEKLVKDRSLSYFTSGPGFIGRDVMNAMNCWSKQPTSTLFIIDGEEDLLVLPAILYAPLGSVVYYGQPDKGIIEVVVTLAMKKRMNDLLAQFKAKP